MRKVQGLNGNLNVNDGNGLYDNEGLIDSLVVDCNNAIRNLVEGKYVLWCNIMVQMVQKLGNLKKGVHDDIESRDKQISDLENLLDEYANSRLKDGEKNGAD